MLQIIVVKVLESKSSVLFDVPINSSKVICRISTKTCWELESKLELQVDKSLDLIGQAKRRGSMDTANFSLTATLKAIDFTNDGNCANSVEEVF